MTLEILYALALFLAGGLGYALGRSHAHETFNRGVGATMDAMLLQLRDEGGEMRIARKAVTSMARTATFMATLLKKHGNTETQELKTINESLQRSQSAEVAARAPFEHLYNCESKKREALEGESETLIGINRVLSRKLVAILAICTNGCEERADRTRWEAHPVESRSGRG
ncbi:MAG: hypothetical protein OXR83_00545 [Acidobacteriota bacterium]|nr:hypothetical protein [Acidobacteriota bacterium]